MKPLIVANWKTNPSSLKEAEKLLESIKKEVLAAKKVKIVICPPFLYLSTCIENFPQISFGAQDCFWEKGGAFTGEISPLMLKNLGCQYVILGHSERRIYLKETDQMINKKIKATLGENLVPIFCVGESEKEKKQGKTFRVLENQLKKGLWGIKAQSFYLAYEPIWAIGTGRPCSPAEAKTVAIFLRKKLSSFGKFGILYGGSVNSKNAKAYIVEAKMDGLLVGGASLNPKEFAGIIKSLSP